MGFNDGDVKHEFNKGIHKKSSTDHMRRLYSQKPDPTIDLSGSGSRSGNNDKNEPITEYAAPHEPPKKTSGASSDQLRDHMTKKFKKILEGSLPDPENGADK